MIFNDKSLLHKSKLELNLLFFIVCHEYTINITGLKCCHYSVDWNNEIHEIWNKKLTCQLLYVSQARPKKIIILLVGSKNNSVNIYIKKKWVCTVYVKSQWRGCVIVTAVYKTSFDVTGCVSR